MDKLTEQYLYSTFKKVKQMILKFSQHFAKTLASHILKTKAIFVNPDKCEYQLWCANIAHRWSIRICCTRRLKREQMSRSHWNVHRVAKTYGFWMFVWFVFVYANIYAFIWYKTWISSEHSKIEFHFKLGTMAQRKLPLS